MLIDKRRKSLYIVITLTAISFALYTQVIWAIVASDTSVPHKDPFQLLISYFPPFLRSVPTITYLTLACSVTAIIFSSAWNKWVHGFGKAIPIIILIVAILITLLTLFQLM